MEASPQITQTIETEAPPKRDGVVDIVRDVCSEVVKNVAMGIPALRSWRVTRPRTFSFAEQQISDMDPLERYAFLALRSLQSVIGSVKDKHIVELGPGDFMTSGFTLLAAGAASYTVIDRFVGDYSQPEAKEWYRQIKQAWPLRFPELPWPEYLDADDFPEAYSDRVKVLPIPIEDVKADRRYDVVCSYQVGEHVNSIEAFAEMNARLLSAPDGVAVHRVDFAAHGCWFYYRDPLTFLRFPDWLWSLMGSNRGTPNRRRFHEFSSAFERAGLDVDVVSRDLYPREDVQIESLAEKFRTMPFDSLETATATFVCRPRKNAEAA